MIEYPKDIRTHKVVSLNKDEEQRLIQCIYMNLNKKTSGILIALFTGVRIGELCESRIEDISIAEKIISSIELFNEFITRKMVPQRYT